VKRGWEISGYSLSGLEMRWAAIWTVTQVSWQLWIMPLRAMDGFSGKDNSFRPVRVDPEAPLSRPDRGSRVFVYFNRGMAKSYKYEFLDLKPDPAAGVSGSCAVSG
jgi:hypothetical protein